jgi:hypothetical protein
MKNKYTFSFLTFSKVYIKVIPEYSIISLSENTKSKPTNHRFGTFSFQIKNKDKK